MIFYLDFQRLISGLKPVRTFILHYAFQTRFVDDFQNVVRLPNDFDTTQERKVLVISLSSEKQEQALQMGAAHAAGLEIIKQAQVINILIFCETKEHDIYACMCI